MQRQFRKLGILAAAVACAACSDSAAPHRSAINGLSAVLQIPSSVKIGDSLVIALVVTNTRDQPVTMNLSADQGNAFDPAVDSANGGELWSSRVNRLFAGAATSVTLAAHGQDVFRTSWNLRDYAGKLVAPGTYRIRGLLSFDTDTLFAMNSPVQILILPQ